MNMVQSPPPAVLLHAGAGSGRQWQALAGTLCTQRAVHTPDFYGHGQARAWPAEMPMSLADEAAPVERLLERLGGAHLVGHSYGAAVALKIASRRPALVRSVLAYEPVLFGLLLDDPGSRRELQSVVGAAESVRLRALQGRPEAAAERFIDFWSGPGTWAALPPERRPGVTSRMAAVMQQFDALFADPLARGDLARLPMPLRLLSGSDTLPVARRIVDLVHAARPGARRERLDGLGHMGPVTHAAVFNRRVLEWLSSLEPRHDRTHLSFTTLMRTSP